MFKKFYNSPQKELWQGREDFPLIASNQRWHHKVQFHDLLQPQTHASKNLKIAFLGFACDEGIKRNQGRVGAKEGPHVLKKTLANLPWHFEKANLQIFDAGTIICRNNKLENAQQALGEAIQKLHHNQFLPIALGGGHEIAWGHYLGFRDLIKNKSLGIINIDAHFDLRSSQNGAHSGTPFYQIAEDQKNQGLDFSYLCLGIQKSANSPHLFQTAQDLGVEFFSAREINNQNPQIAKQLQKFLKSHDHIYLTICLDAFQQAEAPGVSAPSPFGIQAQKILPYLDLILNHGNLIGIDIAELSPPLDENQKTSKLAAQLIFKAVDDLTTQS